MPVDEQMVELVAEIEQEAPRAVDLRVRSWWPWLISAAAVVAIVVSIPAGAVAASVLASQRDTEQQITDFKASQAAREQQVDDSLAKLAESNDLLVSRGQEPVLAPPAPDPEEALTALVLSRVIAALPTAPSAEAVGQTIVGAVTANVQGPSLQRMTALVADYFRANPPQPGPGPTQAEIDAAVARAYAENPPADGRDGTPGTDGRDGTNGTDGAAGRGIATGPEPVRTDAGCVWRTTYTAEPLVEEHPAGEFACPAVTPEQPADETTDPPAT